MRPRSERVAPGWFLHDDQGKSWTTPYFVAKTKPNNKGKNRFGVVVGKKVEERASARNRIKRLLWDVTSYWPPGSCDILIIARPNMKGASRDALRGVVGVLGEQNQRGPDHKKP